MIGAGFLAGSEHRVDVEVRPEAQVRLLLEQCRGGGEDVGVEAALFGGGVAVPDNHHVISILSRPVAQNDTNRWLVVRGRFKTGIAR